MAKDDSDVEKKKEEVVSESELEAKIQAKLDNLDSNSSADEVEEEVEETEKDSTPEKSEKEESEEKEEEKEEKEETEESETDEKQAESEVKLTDEKSSTPDEKEELSEAYLRAAVHQGWTKDEVVKFFDDSPELAKRTFEKIYESTNKLTSEFAALGRAKVAKPAAKESSPEVKVIDIEALEKEYKDDPLFDAVKLLNTEMIRIKSSKPAEIEEATSKLKGRESQLFEQQLNSFFNDDTLAPYGDFYGVVEDSAAQWDDVLTGVQLKKRVELVELADQIILGATQQGINMPVAEALEKAHMLVSAPIKDKVIAKEIKDKLVKRGKSISLKPSSSKSAKKTGNKKVSMAELETKVAGMLAKF